MLVPPRQLSGIVFLLLMVAQVPVAMAQYKWQESDGSIAYGDRPPNRAVKVLQAPPGFTASRLLRADAGAGAASRLPFELRKLAERAPVVLYTTRTCEPCELARKHLTTRGIPFSEKTVNTGQDITAFQEQGFPADAGLPVMTVGGERRIGYHEARWNAVLDSSGYPKDSRLPASFVQTAPEPLASQTQTQTASVEPVQKLEPQVRTLAADRERRGPAPSVFTDGSSNLRF
ncbi:MAG: glutaredoxin family protein [Burkholderiaceae bacterium]